jgi:hypothetical protein
VNEKIRGGERQTQRRKRYHKLLPKTGRVNIEAGRYIERKQIDLLTFVLFPKTKKLDKNIMALEVSVT